MRFEYFSIVLYCMKNYCDTLSLYTYYNLEIQRSKRMIMNHIKKFLYKIKNKEYFMKMTQKHLSCLASYTQGFSLKHVCNI